MGMRGMPGAIGDAFVRLRYRIAVLRLEQEEMAVLVDGLAAEAEVPVDHADRSVQHEIVEPGLLAYLAPRRDGRRLGDLEVALGEAPVAIGVPDQQEARFAVRSPPEYHSARTRLPLRAALFAGHSERGSRNAERGTGGPTSALLFRVPTSAFRVGLEYTEREVLSRIRLDVGQE